MCVGVGGWQRRCVVRPRVSHSQCRSSPKASVVSLGCHKQFLALKSPRRSISSWGLSTSFVVVVSNLYSHDSQWPIRDNSVRKEKE